MVKGVTIVGGGLAGLALGIGLRQRQVPVVVWEAGRYPRHRVCGEFISGAGQSSLARLGLADGLKALGAIPAATAAFFGGHTRTRVRKLPENALCISRFLLDDWLANEFQRLGGDLRVGARWSGEFGPGFVRATGRRATAVTAGERWFGLKVHARAVAMEADLELHFVPAGYVGMCRLADDEVNICGLFRSAVTIPDLVNHWGDWLRGPPESALHSRLRGAEFMADTLCSVAGLCLRPYHATQRRECCVGDALTMIPPLTGNGMSLAIESAELAIGPLTEYSDGRRSWSEAQGEIATACDRRFNRRLRWAAWLQPALFQPAVRAGLLFLNARSETVWRAMFHRTR